MQIKTKMRNETILRILLELVFIETKGSLSHPHTCSAVSPWSIIRLSAEKQKQQKKRKKNSIPAQRPNYQKQIKNILVNW